MVTRISPMPESILKWGRCNLLHEKRPVWDGDCRFDDQSKKDIPNIRWVCDICAKEDKCTE